MSLGEPATATPRGRGRCALRHLPSESDREFYTMSTRGTEVSDGLRSWSKPLGLLRSALAKEPAPA